MNDEDIDPHAATLAHAAAWFRANYPESESAQDDMQQRAEQEEQAQEATP